MARVTDTEVKAILSTTIDTTPFIAAATLIIDANLLTAGLSSDLLKEIERWLSAHLACIRDPRLTSKQLGDTRVAYERGKSGAGLQATSYGQQVAVLDTSGILAQVLGMKRVRIMVD